MCYYGAVYEIGIAANYITVAQEAKAENERAPDNRPHFNKDYVTESKGIGKFFDDPFFSLHADRPRHRNHFRNEMSDYWE